MWKSWKFWTVWGGILGLIGILAFGFMTDPRKVPSPLVGKTAPDFEVFHLDGFGKLKLSDLKGKPVVLNFWASWCVECRAEAHVLESFHQQYGANKSQIQFIGVAIQDTLGRAKAFARKFRKSYFLALDDESGNIALDYGIYGVPETFFIDPLGVIQYKHIGGVTPKIMNEQIQKMLD